MSMEWSKTLILDTFLLGYYPYFSDLNANKIISDDRKRIVSQAKQVFGGPRFTLCFKAWNIYVKKNNFWVFQKYRFFEVMAYLKNQC